MASSTKILKNFTCVYPLRYIIKNSNVGTTILFNKELYSSVIPIRSFKSNVHLLSKEKFTRDASKIVKKDGTVIRQKTPKQVMINLIKDSGISVLSLNGVKNLAKAKGLNLVKVDNQFRSQRETYKLLKDSELDNEDMKKPIGNSNDYKMIVFSPKIDKHDLEIKVKSLLRLLHKNKKLKCVVKKIGNPERAESLNEELQAELKKTNLPLNIISKTSSNTSYQFLVEPNLKTEPQTREDKTD